MDPKKDLVKFDPLFIMPDGATPRNLASPITSFNGLREALQQADIKVWLSSTPYGKQLLFVNIPFVTFFLNIAIKVEGVEVYAAHVKF